VLKEWNPKDSERSGMIQAYAVEPWRISTTTFAPEVVLLFKSSGGTSEEFF
jgi:hypothetical protein